MRDVVDHLEHDIDPDKWINSLLKAINSGRYEPATPVRFTLGKGSGFSRTMTLPSVPDLVLYRTIVDAIYRRVARREHKHVYFRRAKLDAVQQQIQGEAVELMREAAEYNNASVRSFFNWLKYDQYRKYLLLDRVYPFLVITDVSNFFDSVLHSHVEEAIRGLPVPARMTGLLFFLLERLSIRQDYAGSHGISLPVDEFDCSRTLAHIVLFSHDDVMVRLVGADAYVRWMDDQNFGVQSRAEGLRVLARVGRSLGRLHLTPNAKKSRILTLSEARRHFHLDLNRLLDEAEAVARERIPAGQKRRRLRSLVFRLWAQARSHQGKGEFGKVLKRLYRLAGLAQARFLRRRAIGDILNDPNLTARVCSYMQASGTSLEYLRFAEAVLNSEEQVYPDITVAIMESFLRLEPRAHEARRIRELAVTLLRGTARITGATESAVIAPVLILRFGDRRSVPLLLRMIEEQTRNLAGPVVRSIGIVAASYGRDEFRRVRRSASRLLVNHLANVVLLVERIQNYNEVPVRYKQRLKLRFDAVTRMRFADMRSILTLRLLALSKNRNVLNWVGEWKAAALEEPVSAYDRLTIRRLLP